VYWLELTVHADREAVDSISAIFSDYVFGGVVIEDPIIPDPGGDGYAVDLTMPVTIRGYLPVDDRAGDTCAALRTALDHLSLLRPVGPLTIRQINEDDWANAWKEHIHVLHLGQHIVIVPTWREYTPRPDDVVIHLDPGAAFGTGLHPTTQLCIEALEVIVRPGMRILDVGTGSGILSLVAGHLGARQVVALDTDPVAVAAAQENIRRNTMTDRIVLYEGTLPHPSVPPAAFDVVVANITAKALCSLAPHMVAALRPRGTLIASGVISDQAEEVIRTMQAAGLCDLQSISRDDWLMISGVRPNPYGER